MKKAFAILGALSVILALTACGKKEKAAEVAAYPVKIETVDGVRTVVNPAFPKEGVVRYTLLDDLTLGGESGGTESVLNRPFDLRVDALGNIFVLDWGDIRVQGLRAGRAPAPGLRQGRARAPGSSPSPPISILPPTAGSSSFHPGSTRWSSSTATGKYLSSFRLDGFCDKLGVDRHNRIYYSQMLTPEEGGGEEFKLVQNRMALFKSDEFGRERTRLGEYLDVTMMRKIQKDMVTSMSSRESPTTSWLVGPDDRVCHRLQQGLSARRLRCGLEAPLPVRPGVHARPPSRIQGGWSPSGVLPGLLRLAEVLRREGQPVAGAVPGEGRRGTRLRRLLARGDLPEAGPRARVAVPRPGRSRLQHRPAGGRIPGGEAVQIGARGPRWKMKSNEIGDMIPISEFPAKRSSARRENCKIRKLVFVPEFNGGRGANPGRARRGSGRPV